MKPKCLTFPISCAIFLFVSICTCLAQQGAVTASNPASAENTLRKAAGQLETTHGKVSFAVHYPEKTGADTPVIWIVHGFLRGKGNMDGWAKIAAEMGYVGIAIDTPTSADHVRNGRALAALVELADQGKIPDVPPGKHPRIFAGYSAGGLSSLVAASASPERTALWIGLDPVDRGGVGAGAIAKLRCPIAILRAEPSAWNANGNAKELWRSVSAPGLHLIIDKASHADLENPYDSLAGMICGSSGNEQREAFILIFKKLLEARLYEAAAPAWPDLSKVPLVKELETRSPPLH